MINEKIDKIIMKNLSKTGDYTISRVGHHNAEIKIKEKNITFKLYINVFDEDDT